MAWRQSQRPTLQWTLTFLTNKLCSRFSQQRKKEKWKKSKTNLLMSSCHCVYVECENFALKKKSQCKALLRVCIEICIVKRYCVRANHGWKYVNKFYVESPSRRRASVEELMCWLYWVGNGTDCNWFEGKKVLIREFAINKLSVMFTFLILAKCMLFCASCENAPE